MPSVLSTLLVLVLIWSGAAHAATDRFVSAKGNDLGGVSSCLSSAAPCRTLANALAQAASDDIIKVAKGTYKENVSLTTGGTRTIKGGYDAKTFSEGTRDVARNETTFTGGKVGVFLTISADAGVSIPLTLDGLVIAQSVGESPQYGGGVSAAALNGGAIDLALDQVTMTGNQAFGGGGGLYLKSDSGAITARITRSLFSSNKGVIGGGAIRAFASGTATATITLTVEDSTFRGNRGGGFRFGHIILGADGGAILAEHGGVSGGFIAVTLRRAIFDSNDAVGGDGGAISVGAWDSGAWPGVGAGSISLTLENSILQGNTANFGGAVSIASNAVSPPAYGTATATADLRNNTIVGNKGASGGGMAIVAFNGSADDGVGSATATATLQNNIFHANATNKVYGANNDIEIYLQSNAFSTPGAHASLSLKTNNVGLIRADELSPHPGSAITVVADPDPQLNVDPQLVKKQGIYRLKATSPMIGAGTCDGAPAVDFEGDPRPPGTGLCGVDIGADEFIP